MYCETNELAGVSQGTEGQQLAPTPVDAALADAFCTLLRDGCDAGVSSEALRKIDVGLSDLHEFFAGDGGVQTVRKFLRTGDALLSLSLLLFSELNLVEDGLHLVVEVTCNCFSVLVGQVTAANQVFGVLGAGGFAVVDDVVHLRLSHRRVVGFVVATAAVAHEVDEDVLAEATAVLGRQATNPHDSLGVVAVDVEHRAAESLRHVGGVVAGAGGIRCGGETDLVVNHDVDGTANGVSTQLSEVDGLGHDAEASERSITVEEDRNNGVSVRAEVQDVLLSADDALHHRVDGLEVGGVGGQSDLDFAITEHLQVGAFSTEVVLDVAGTTSLGGIDVAFELVEQGVQGLANDVG